jgi:hypothetical protein
LWTVPFSALPCLGHQSILGFCPERGAVPHHTSILDHQAEQDHCGQETGAFIFWPGV